MTPWVKSVLFSLSSGLIVVITNFMTMAAEKQLASLSDISDIQWAILVGGGLLAMLNGLRASLTKSPKDDS